MFPFFGWLRRTHETETLQRVKTQVLKHSKVSTRKLVSPTKCKFYSGPIPIDNILSMPYPSLVAGLAEAAEQKYDWGACA